MNKLIRLSPTGIEYGDYAWNFASGCGNNIGGKCKSGGFKCWAYSITERFEGHYPNGFKPTVYPEALFSPLYLKKPSRILCAFMGDLFWDCPEFNPDEITYLDVPAKSMAGVLAGGLRNNTRVGMSLKGWVNQVMIACPQHKFLFLTKQPQNLSQWSPFPDNCFVGVTATNERMALDGMIYLADIQCSIRYLSLEPLLDRVFLPPKYFKDCKIGLVIIGAQTSPYKPPKIEHVQEIVQACDKAGIPVFLKDNLSDLIPVNSCLRYGAAGELRLRQEMPVCQKPQ